MTKAKICLVLFVANFVVSGAAAQPPKVDRYGDPLPTGAIARLGTVRFRAPDEANALAFAPDGKTVAIASRGGLCLFDAESGRRIKRLGEAAFTGNLQNRLAFSADGKRLAAWGRVMVSDEKGYLRPKRTVHVWELASERKPREYDGERLIWLGWSADGEAMAAFLDKDGPSLRELASGKSRRFECPNLRRPELSDYVQCACAPAGRALAVVDEQNTIHVWDTANGTKRCAVSPTNEAALRDVVLSPDGRSLATLQQGRGAPYRDTVHIWDSATGRHLRTMATDPKNHISTLAFAPDGKTLAAAGWNGIRWHDAATGRELSRGEGAGSNTEKIAFSADGQTLATLQRYSCAFHLWDMATGKRKPEPAGHTGRPYGTLSPDSLRMVSCASYDAAHIWDLATSELLFYIHLPGGSASCAEFSRDGRSLYCTCGDDNLWICDAATGERQHAIKLEDRERPETRQNASSMHLSTDAKTLVALSYYYPKKNDGPRYDETLITGWDPTTRKQLFSRRLPGTAWNAVSADARLLAVAYSSSGFDKAPAMGPMRIEDLATGRLLLTFPNLEGQSWPLAFSPDGRVLASIGTNSRMHKEGDAAKSESSVLLWELATASEILSLPRAGQDRVAFSPNGRLLAVTAPPQDIVVWDLAQGAELRRFKGFDAEVTWLAFAPDGRRLVSGLADSTLLIWDVEPPATPPAHKLTAVTVGKAWDDLGSKDAVLGFRARWALVSAPELALPLLQKHMKPVQPADPHRLQKLIDDLDSQQFPARNAANSELEKLGELAADALQQAVTKKTSLELSRRAQALLDKLRGPVTRPEVLRAVRAAAVLEDIASPEARKLLDQLAQGAPETRLTLEAQAAVKRLGNR
jgi:WD40 repeat protein